MKKIFFIISMSCVLNSLASDPLEKIKELRNKLDRVEELKGRSQKLSAEMEQFGTKLATVAARVEISPLDPIQLVLLKEECKDQVEAVQEILEDGAMLTVTGQKSKNPA